jgi:hypothetical protein
VTDQPLVENVSAVAVRAVYVAAVKLRDLVEGWMIKVFAALHAFGSFGAGGKVSCQLWGH